MHATVEVEIGPAMRGCMDVLELVSEVLELVPDWHEQERAELLSRTETLMELALGRLNVGAHG